MIKQNGDRNISISQTLILIFQREQIQKLSNVNEQTYLYRFKVIVLLCVYVYRFSLKFKTYLESWKRASGVGINHIHSLTLSQLATSRQQWHIEEQVMAV